MNISNIYYMLKPVIPRSFQLFVRRKRVEYLMQFHKDSWPIDPQSVRPPQEWIGWPDQKKFALVLTHDVEWDRGQQRCRTVAQLEQENDFVSAFYFVPERYKVSSTLRSYLTGNGFEVGVHDLNHDGRLFSSKKIFQTRALRINKIIQQWKASGFRAGAMHHNLQWIGELDIKYDCSTFDTDPFEPQPDGVRTIFPFIVKRPNSEMSYVEMPYTMPQDFTLFILMRHETIDVWKRKLDWIAKNGGMALVNTHPDYMCLKQGYCEREEYPVENYKELLRYVMENYEGEYWNALPREVASYIKSTCEAGVKMVNEG